MDSRNGKREDEARKKLTPNSNSISNVLDQTNREFASKRESSAAFPDHLARTQSKEERPETRTEHGKSGSDLEWETENDEDEFHVRDLLLSNSDEPRAEPYVIPSFRKRNNTQLHLRYMVNYPQLFYLLAAILTVALAELMLRKHLEKTETALIAKLQGSNDWPGWRIFFDLFGFPPQFWGLAPGLALTFLPGFRLVSFRIVVLNSVGRFMKWTLNHVFFGARPFWVSSKVKMWHCPQAYGCPSGHALLLMLVVWPICEELLPSIRAPRNGEQERLVSERDVFDPQMLRDDIGYVYRDVHLKRDRWWAVMGVVVLSCCYGINMFSRIYLGTHFIHDIVMGILVALLLLTICTAHNAKVAFDRLSTFAAEAEFSEYYSTVACRGFLLLVLLVSMAETTWALAVHVHGKDPEVWAVRSRKYCNLPIENGNVQIGLPYVYGAIGSLLGAITALSLLARPDGRYLFPAAKFLEAKVSWRLIGATFVQVVGYWVIYGGVLVLATYALGDAFRNRVVAGTEAVGCFVAVVWSEFLAIRLLAPLVEE